MANDVGLVRSNYFRVKSRKAFDAWVKTLVGWVAVFPTREEDPADIVAIGCEEGYWPSSKMVEVDGEEEEQEIDFLPELGAHLADSEVCILMDAGFCKARYAYGHAIAFDNKGTVTEVNLTDIYDKAKKLFGVEPTRAEY